MANLWIGSALDVGFFNKQISKDLDVVETQIHSLEVAKCYRYYIG